MVLFYLIMNFVDSQNPPFLIVTMYWHYTYAYHTQSLNVPCAFSISQPMLSYNNASLQNYLTAISEPMTSYAAVIMWMAFLKTTYYSDIMLDALAHLLCLKNKNKTKQPFFYCGLSAYYYKSCQYRVVICNKMPVVCGCFFFVFFLLISYDSTAREKRSLNGRFNCCWSHKLWHYNPIIARSSLQ